MRDPQKPQRSLSDKYPPDPEIVKLTESISEALKKNYKGKEFSIVELIHGFRDVFKVPEEDIKVALSTLINHGKIKIKSVCFLRVNMVQIPE